METIKKYFWLPVIGWLLYRIFYVAPKSRAKRKATKLAERAYLVPLTKAQKRYNQMMGWNR